MGGVEIDTRAATAVPGLYAAGEVTGGVQGSNRLSSNSLSEVNVFGRIAGREAARYAACASGCAREAAERSAQTRLRCAEGGASMSALLEALHGKLKQVMFAHAGIVRDAASMQAGLRAIADLRSTLTAAGTPSIADVKRYYEIANMLDVGEAVTRCALYREESRGSHFRVDFPERDDARWRVVTRVNGAAGRLTVAERTVARGTQPA
jgi:succinate dehydrogenase/fumarate reductase flavoprotein subunit